jgi:hypothetical protein
MRLLNVAAPIPPDDFNICDISSFPKNRRKQTLIASSFQQRKAGAWNPAAPNQTEIRTNPAYFDQC